MGTRMSSFIRMIWSRSSASSCREEREVMLKTRRKPCPVFMYSSLQREMSLVSYKLHRCRLPHRSCKDVKHFISDLKIFFVNSLNCSVPAVSRISRTTCLPLDKVSMLTSLDMKWVSIHPLRASSDMNPQSWGRNSLSRHFGRIVLSYDSARCFTGTTKKKKCFSHTS